MKNFTLGPVEMFHRTAIIRDKGFCYFRTQEFSNIMINNSKRLAKILNLQDFNSIIYLAMSGTGAMEATIQNCITNKDKSLVINGGTFGHRFCEMLKWHNCAYDSINLKWDEELSYNHLKPYENKNYTTLFVNLHETGTGQLYDIKLLSDFCKRNNLFLIVDAISTILADDYDIEKYGIDVTIFSSQKGLCLSPGMSMIALSQRMIEKLHTIPKQTTFYADFKDYLKNIKRGQTPFTPPVCVIFELDDMLNFIDEKGGKKAWLKKIEEKCLYFRKQAKKFGFKIPEFKKSNMLTPIYLENIDAYKVFCKLKDDFGIYINPCGGELATKLLRISHIGNTTLEDIDDLLEKLIKITKDI